MPIHPAVAGKLLLLAGASSLHEFAVDPAWADQRKAFEGHAGYEAPAVATRMDEVPGPHGPVPVRIYGPARRTPRRAWCGCTAAASRLATSTCRKRTG